MPPTATTTTRSTTATTIRFLRTVLLMALWHHVNGFSTLRSPFALTTSLSSSSVAGTTPLSNAEADGAANNAAANPSTATVPASAFSAADDDELAAAVDWDWRQLAQDVFREDSRPIILFDGVCNLCNGGVNFALDQDESGKFRFCSLQSKVGRSLLLAIGKRPDDMTSIILLTGPSAAEAHLSSAAVARICGDLDAVPLQLFGKLGEITPPFIRESIYQFVSENRYRFGEVDSCRMDYDGTLTARFVQDPPELQEDVEGLL